MNDCTLNDGWWECLIVTRSEYTETGGRWAGEHHATAFTYEVPAAMATFKAGSTFNLYGIPDEQPIRSLT